MASQLNAFDLNTLKCTHLRAGCIIRASLLDEITHAFNRSPVLPTLLLDEYFLNAVNTRQRSRRKVVQTGIELASRCSPTARPGLF